MCTHFVKNELTSWRYEWKARSMFVRRGGYSKYHYHVHVWAYSYILHSGHLSPGLEIEVGD